MYTATLKSKTYQRAANRILVVVTFTDETGSFDKEFSFAPNTTTDVMKKTAVTYLNELNSAASLVDGLADLNYKEATPTKPTAAELAQQAWEEKWGKLQKANELVAAGILTGNEPAYTALKNTVKADFKASYL